MNKKLLVTKAEALELLNAQIQIAENNMLKKYESGDDYENDRDNWLQITRYILKEIFPGDDELNRFETSKQKRLAQLDMWVFNKEFYEKMIKTLESIKAFLNYYDEPDAIPKKIAPKIERKFNFTKDKSLQAIIKRDYQELIASIHNKSVKSILVLSGSILEAILLDKALANIDKIVKSEMNIFKMDLHELKNSLAEIDIVIKEADIILTYIKDYRNIIHPGKEKRGDFKITEQDALAVFHNLEAIIEKLSIN